MKAVLEVNGKQHKKFTRKQPKTQKTNQVSPIHQTLLAQNAGEGTLQGLQVLTRIGAQTGGGEGTAAGVVVVVRGETAFGGAACVFEGCIEICAEGKCVKMADKQQARITNL